MQSDANTQTSVQVVTVTLNPAIDQTLTIPNFAAGQVNRVEQSEAHPGGKGVNVAACLADDGRSVAVTGFLGRDNAGLFEALFAQKRVLDCFVRVAGPTRTGIKITDPAQRQTTDINFPGLSPNPGDREALLMQLAVLPTEWAVLSGSIPPGLDPSIYRDLIALLKQQGRRVALDTSGAALRHALDAVPEVVKPNRQELEQLLGRALDTPAAIVEAARTLIERGVELVVVSLGSDGAVFINKNDVVTARPPAIEVASTVGAGDAMVAGIVAAQLDGLSLAECARLATAFSLSAISELSTGLSSQAPVATLREQVTVEQQAI